MLVLQIMGAIAQFEQALIVERTKAGYAAARAQGRIGAIPPCAAAIRSCWAGAASREQTRLATLLSGADAWLTIVPRLPPRS
jgi:DNA invertase Pin-like site-specific DNA recombinase